MASETIREGGGVSFLEIAPYLIECATKGCPELNPLIPWQSLYETNPRLTFQQAEYLGDTALTLRSDQEEKKRQFIECLREAGLTKKGN
jgi:hypothetical protein